MGLYKFDSFGSGVFTIWGGGLRGRVVGSLVWVGCERVVRWMASAVIGTALTGHPPPYLLPRCSYLIADVRSIEFNPPFGTFRGIHLGRCVCAL